MVSDSSAIECETISTISLAVVLISVIRYAHAVADRSVAKNPEFKGHRTPYTR